MPPHVPRKRLRNSPPASQDAAKPTTKKQPVKKEQTTPLSKRRKTTLYDDLDASATPNSVSILEDLANDSESSSSLTSLSDSDFEDVPVAKKLKLDDSAGEDSEEGDEDEIEFEDVAAPASTIVPLTAGDLELTLRQDPLISLSNPYGEKRGPSKRERRVRNASHRLHVMYLLWHNALRNSWLCDPIIQATMISHLTPKMWEEVDRWRRNSGLQAKETSTVAQKPAASASKTPQSKSKSGRKTRHDEHERDWGTAAEKLEESTVDMSHGDPLFRLLRYLASWWKQRFRITAPGLRKWGYMSLERLIKLRKAHTADADDPDSFGQILRNREELRKCAEQCQGSRDVGSQLFTALLRGLGLEARMIANLQTLGFGFTKWEDAEPEKSLDKTEGSSKPRSADEIPEKKTPKTNRKASSNKSASQSSAQKRQSTRNSDAKQADARKSDQLRPSYEDTDDESVVGIETTPKQPIKRSRKFDTDLEYPLYWSEVLSPVTQKYVPVDVTRLSVATNRELIESFEPRGVKADRRRQMMAYVVAHNQDGTAKDVTVRYLKKNIFPGKAKAHRFPVEKVAVHDRNGKVKRYEQFDWFKTAMSGYVRGTKAHPITETDRLEDVTDLRPAEPEKKQVKEGEETLQYYKQSKEFVLERHLKREEALKPGAQPVRVFKGKGKGGAVEEEDVFLRSDVLKVKSAETWHKQGREPLPGEVPLKRVPYRAATTNRRRELAEAEAATGEKVLQGLFSAEQTDWIIPPPIENGIIPKNSYGNIDLFAENMCPAGAVHIPYKGTAGVCKRLGVDFADAVVGFEFGSRMAVPVIGGVVVAEEHYDHVMEELEKFEAEKKRKADEKRRKTALAHWRKFLKGMRIVERFRQEYGDIDESVSVFKHQSQKPDKGETPASLETNEPAGAEEGGGGFLPEGYEEEEEEEDEDAPHLSSSFFPVAADEDDDSEEDSLVVADGVEETSSRKGKQSASKISPQKKRTRGKAG